MPELKTMVLRFCFERTDFFSPDGKCVGRELSSMSCCITSF